MGNSVQMLFSMQGKLSFLVSLTDYQKVRGQNVLVSRITLQQREQSCRDFLVRLTFLYLMVTALFPGPLRATEKPGM